MKEDRHVQRIHQVQFVSNAAVRSATYRQNGTLQTLYLGSPKSPRQTRIYDKCAELIDKGAQPTHGAITRVERVIRTGIPLSALQDLSNPFSGLSICVMPGCPPGEKEYIWSMFLAACERDGINAALARLPKRMRARTRNHLKGHTVTWWKPADLWLDWPSRIAALGLLEPLHA